MAEKMRALGYICPECGKRVYGERTEFALQAAAVALVCDCGRSELKAEPDGSTFRVTTPCGVCGGEHRAEVPAASVMEGQGVGLACPETRQLCCYIGEPRRVAAALDDLEETIQKRKEGQSETFVDDVIMYEVLSELRDIAARGGISCTCGSKNWTFQVNYSSVDLQCRDCGAQMRIPAATADDLDDICCKTTLLLRGKESK